MHTIRLFFAVLMAFAAFAQPRPGVNAVGGRELVLPAVGRIDRGTHSLLTSITITNPSDTAAGFTMRFVPLGRSDGPVVADTIGARVTKTYHDVAGTLFNASGVGALRIQGSNNLIAFGRVSLSAHLDDTRGAILDAVPVSAGIRPGESGFLQSVTMDSGRRYNVFLVEVLDAPTVATIEVRDADGTVVGTQDVFLPALEQRILALSSIQSVNTIRGGSIRVTNSGPTGGIIAAGSLVSNTTDEALGFDMALAAPGGPVSSINGLRGDVLIGGGTNVEVTTLEQGILISASAPEGPPGPAGPEGPAGPPGPQGAIGPAGPKGDTGATGAVGPAGEAGAPGAQGPQGIAGPEGPSGPTGPQGAAGAAGAKGDPGVAGPAGPKGDTGAIGPAGPKGDTGAVGPAGPKGDTGAMGAAGPKGDTGAIGPVGPKGDTGAIGPVGPKGDAGAIGPVGPKGDTGAIGPVGPKGDAGAIGPVGPKGDAGAIGPVGPKGDAGAIGPAGPKGDAGAIGPVGPKGDAGAIGPAGPKGDTGATGPQGIAGPQGPAGAKGDTGAIGLAGPKGEPGVAGPTGAAGPQGAQGPQGVAGPQGAQGATGPQGEAGPPGLKGDAGATGPAGAQGPQGEIGPQGLPGPAGAVGPAGSPGESGPAGPRGPRGLSGTTGVENEATDSIPLGADVEILSEVEHDSTQTETVLVTGTVNIFTNSDAFVFVYVDDKQAGIPFYVSVRGGWTVVPFSVLTVIEPGTHEISIRGSCAAGNARAGTRVMNILSFVTTAGDATPAKIRSGT